MRESLSLLSAVLCVLIAVGCASTAAQNHTAPPISTPTVVPEDARSVPTDAKHVKEVVVESGGVSTSVGLWLTADKLIIQAQTGQVLELNQPYGKYAMATLDVIASSLGQNLLVTVREAFKPTGWVLILKKDGFHIALEVHADYDIGVIDGAVRARSRQYEMAGGFWLLSQYYRANSSTGFYELVASEGQPAFADLGKEKSGVLQAISSLQNIVEYRSGVETAGFHLAFMVYESPSWYTVAVGEDRPEKLTVTRWFVVRKADGLVLEWDMAKGPAPKD